MLNYGNDDLYDGVLDHPYSGDEDDEGFYDDMDPDDVERNSANLR